MSSKIQQLLKHLSEPRTSVQVRSTHDGRSITAAEKQGWVMEYTDDVGTRWFMRTELGDAAMLLAESHV